jgi:MFS family permease
MPTPDPQRRRAAAVLAVCFAMNMLGRGMSETFTVFLLPLEAAFDWRRSQLTGVYALYMVVHGLFAPVLGMVYDRLGPRVSYGLGLLCFAVGFIMASRIDSPWELYLYTGVLTGIAVASLSMVTGASLISHWYAGRMGTAMGVAYAGYGFGVIAIVPLTQLIIDINGWRAAYAVLGLLAAVALPLTLLLPWSAWTGPTTQSRTRRQTDAPQWTLASALRSGPFWGLFAVFFFTAAAIYSISVQAVAYLVSVGYPPISAATAFGSTGILSTCGMASAGWMMDRLGPRRTVAVSFSMTIAGTLMLMLLSRYPAAWLLGVAIFVFGLSAGSRGPVISSLSARIFSGTGQGTIYGTITMGMGLGAAIGAWASGMLYDATARYEPVFVFSVVCSLCAMAQFWLVPRLGRAQ